MLDVQQLRRQFDDFSAYQSREQALLSTRLEAALAALDDCAPAWTALRDRAVAQPPRYLVPYLRENPAATAAAPARPTPLTVVATDGSQIFPDRHVEPHCYLLNISRIAFQYGTLDRPLMESVPHFKFRKEDVADPFDELPDDANAEVVSALRDEFELSELLSTARRARKPGRPLVALADGTLIRWMIRRMQNRALEDRLIDRYAALLADFQANRIPLCSYVSMPGTTEIVNLLRFHRNEDETVPPEAALAGLLDRWIFERTLPEGHRSAVFESASHIQQDYGDQDRICYFYVHVPARRGSEVARVELPRWVADDAALLDLVHATILDECRKGEGYPMILSEAHEHAVIRAHERGLFYDLVARELNAAGLRHATSLKHASKRRPLV